MNEASNSKTSARACANIALAKYWGKSIRGENIPAVPSLSLTLSGLSTETHVSFRAHEDEDLFVLNGKVQKGESLHRAIELLDRVRKEVGSQDRIMIETKNAFPTASGLASSASGFCALACAARGLFELPFDRQAISRLARKSSASAARSAFAGFAFLEGGIDLEEDIAAFSLASARDWDLRAIVCVVSEEAKETSSRKGMKISQETSPYFSRWLERSRELADEMKTAVARQDFERLGELSEQSTGAMHALTFSSTPSYSYLNGVTLRILGEVRSLQDLGYPIFCTMDAGPHVKAFCMPENLHSLEERLSQVPGVLRTIACSAGPAVELME